jgi:catechol 2,3-dioxygenase-like lactoylglutathione lyase family enzyme
MWSVDYGLERLPPESFGRGLRHSAGGRVLRRQAWAAGIAVRPQRDDSRRQPRVYRSGGGPALNVYQLRAVGVEFARYDQFEHDAKGITARAGGGRIAWFRDPDGNTFALEADR